MTSTTNISGLLEHAATSNEDGVYELAGDNIDEALQCLEQGIDDLTRARLVRRPSSSGLLNDDETTATTLPASRCSVEVHLRDADFYLYGCAMTFQFRASDANTPQTHVAFYCASNCFNLALAYHHRGQQYQRDGNLEQATVALETALQKYEEAARHFSLLHHLMMHSNKEAAQARSYLEGDVALMRLALVNNQAQIYSALHQPEAAQELFQILLPLATSALQEPVQFSNFEQYHLQEFVRNAMVFGSVQDSVVAAPCA